MTLSRRTAILAIVTSLAGCAVTSSAPDGGQIADSQGILAISLSSNTSGHLDVVQYTSEVNLSGNTAVLKKTIRIIDGEQYLVVPLKAGTYYLSEFSVGVRSGRLYSSPHFHISPGTISYIGHIRILSGERRFAVQSADRELDMKNHLKENFPMYFQSLPFEKELIGFR